MISYNYHDHDYRNYYNFLDTCNPSDNDSYDDDEIAMQVAVEHIKWYL